MVKATLNVGGAQPTILTTCHAVTCLCSTCRCCRYEWERGLTEGVPRQQGLCVIPMRIAGGAARVGVESVGNCAVLLGQESPHRSSAGRVLRRA